MAFGLKIYRFRLHKPGQKRTERERFMMGGAHDPLSHLTSYLRARKGNLVKLEASTSSLVEQANQLKAFSIDSVRVDKPARRISGICAVGEFGRSGKLKNVESGSVAYNKKRDDSDLEPFFYRFDVPDGLRHGILIVGSRGIASPKGAIERDGKRHFATATEFALSIDPLHDLESLKEYIAGGADTQELEIIGKKQTKDSREIMNAKVGGKSLDEGSRLTVRINHSGVLRRMAKQLTAAVGNKEKVRKLVEVPGMKEWETARVKIKNADGKERWFNLVQPGNSGLNYDVSGEVEYGPDGYPTYESMLSRSSAMLEELRDLAFNPGE